MEARGNTNFFVMLSKDSCNERGLTHQIRRVNEAVASTGGVEDTALHCKCEMSGVVKKTTYAVAKTASLNWKPPTFLRANLLDDGLISKLASPPSAPCSPTYHTRRMLAPSPVHEADLRIQAATIATRARRWCRKVPGHFVIPTLGRSRSATGFRPVGE